MVLWIRKVNQCVVLEVSLPVIYAESSLASILQL